MKTISIDIETYSSVNLQKCSVYKYAESPDFEVLLFAYSVDGGEVRVVDLANGEIIPHHITRALRDPNVIKWAFNAQFERICLSRFLGTWLSPNSWRCSLVWAATLGLPLSLEGVGAVLGLEKQKLKEGKDLIRYFCIPCKPTKTNSGRTKNLPSHSPEKWDLFKTYNKRDVETELNIQQRLQNFPVSETEWQHYVLDQEISDRGILLDSSFVKQAILCDEKFRQSHLDMARDITGLTNPNSTAQLKSWLSDQGVETESLSKLAVSELLENVDGDIEAALSLRQDLAKSSVKKYAAMENVICKDSRAHGLLQFYGANRTGRWAGRLIQVQNLPQNHLPDLAIVRKLVRIGNFDVVEFLYDSVPSVLSELIRTAFVPKPGHEFLVADFSAIEARFIAFLAGEQWRQDVFAAGGDIYCASASQMFHVPVEKNGVNGELRQKGKIAELALGYGGSVGALKSMGAIRMGIPEEELQPLVDAWRSANTKIVKLWSDIDRATKTCVKAKTTTASHGIRFAYQSGMLFIYLPSGRRLAYVKPRMGTNRFGSESILYDGVDGTKKWSLIESYGAKFVENIVQAACRDLLAEAMQNLNAAGFRIVIHVHDEVVIEAPIGTSLDTIYSIMGKSPSWASGLLLNADGYTCNFYKTD